MAEGYVDCRWFFLSPSEQSTKKKSIDITKEQSIFSNLEFLPGEVYPKGMM